MSTQGRFIINKLASKDKFLIKSKKDALKFILDVIGEGTDWRYKGIDKSSNSIRISITKGVSMVNISDSNAVAFINKNAFVVKDAREATAIVYRNRKYINEELKKAYMVVSEL